MTSTIVVTVLAGLVTAQPSAKLLIQAEAPTSIIAATVDDIPKGSKATVSPEAVVIDEAKKVWLNKHVPVGGETGVMVLHLENGTFAVEITDDKLRWLKVPLTDDLKKALILVSKIAVKPAPPPTAVPEKNLLGGKKP